MGFVFRCSNACLWGALAVALTTAMLARPAAAQVDTGAIQGTVRDSSGGVVPGATVTLTNVGTNTSSQTTTNISLTNIQNVSVPGFSGGGAGLPPPPGVLDFSNTANFGRITALRFGPNDQRQIQLALKYYF